MSLEIFKQNMLSYMQNPHGISSYGDFAKKLTMEYDMAVKRGFDSVNNITIAKGNTELMESILNGILNTALQQSSGEHPIITNMGPAFIAYWTGATMSSVPPPIIPSTGAVINIATISSFITDPGIWQPTDIQSLTPIPPMTSDGANEPSTEELLKTIPDDNNTAEGAKEVVDETGVEILTDGGEDGGSQIESVKQELGDDNPPYEEKTSPDEIAVTTSSAKPLPIDCGQDIDYDTQLSPHYKLKHLSIATTFPHKVKAQVGLSRDEIVCNLKNLAINIIEPIKAKYPNVKINSAFRGTASIPGGISQHQKGEAVDLQFVGIAPKDYLPIAKWIAGTLPFDQMIFEHGNSIWLHVSCKRDGVQRKQLLTMLHGKYSPGLKCYY